MCGVVLCMCKIGILAVMAFVGAVALGAIIWATWPLRRRTPHVLAEKSKTDY
jgi:hypothetical protein